MTDKVPATSVSLETLKNWALPVVIVIGSGMSAWMMKIDDRLYDFQGNVVTEKQLEKVEQRMLDRIDNLDEKLDKLLERDMERYSK